MDRRSPETEIGGQASSFKSTLWSVILKAKDPDAPERRDALQKLAVAYWKPLYFFARRRGNGPEASKDIIQGFFSALLERHTLQYLDRSRGKFRTFLLTALEHYMCDEHDRSTAQKRGGGRTVLSLDFEGAEGESPAPAASGEASNQTFVREWAVHVLAQGLEIVRRSYETSGKSAEFEAFRPHLTALRPSDATYVDLANALGMGVGDVRNRIRLARSRYRDAILEIIRSYTETADEAREELRELLSAFS